MPTSYLLGVAIGNAFIPAILISVASLIFNLGQKKRGNTTGIKPLYVFGISYCSLFLLTIIIGEPGKSVNIAFAGITVLVNVFAIIYWLFVILALKPQKGLSVEQQGIDYRTAQNKTAKKWISQKKEMVSLIVVLAMVVIGCLSLGESQVNSQTTSIPAEITPSQQTKPVQQAETTSLKTYKLNSSSKKQGILVIFNELLVNGNDIGINVTYDNYRNSNVNINTMRLIINRSAVYVNVDWLNAVNITHPSGDLQRGTKMDRFGTVANCTIKKGDTVILRTTFSEFENGYIQYYDIDSPLELPQNL